MPICLTLLFGRNFDICNLLKNNDYIINKLSIKMAKKDKKNSEKEDLINKKFDDKKAENKKDKKSKKKNKKVDFEEKFNEMNDKYVRLSAEFDNYRKRTLKERMEMMRNAGEDILINFLPVMDNIERAKQSIDDAKEIDAIKEGITLIHKNIFDFLTSRGISEINAVGEVFNTDFHEALTKTPAPEDNLKGKVVDVIEKGYKIKDKVLRFAKVVIGE